MPLVEEVSGEVGREIPVVIVGNKTDKVELLVDQREDYVSVKEVLKNVVRSFRQVQMGIECSAFYDKNIKKLFR